MKLYTKKNLLKLDDRKAKKILPKGYKKDELQFLWVGNINIEIEKENHYYKPYGRKK